MLSFCVNVDLLRAKAKVFLRINQGEFEEFGAHWWKETWRSVDIGKKD